MKHDFHYISKHDSKVKEAFANLMNLLKELQELTKDKFTFQCRPVGSYSRNMITYDAKSNIGFDFDINIEINDSNNEYTANEIRSILINGLRRIAKKYKYDDPEDSTRVLTIKVKDRKNSRIINSCDLAIVNNYIDEEGFKRQEYIHFDKKQKSYRWCEQGNGYYEIMRQLDQINGLGKNKVAVWQEVRKLYLEKKNKNNNPYVHSRQIFSMTINQISQIYDLNKE